MLKDTPVGGLEAFSVSGKVMEGKHMGHRLGFPTVNLPRPQLSDLPPNGVHAAMIKVLSGEFSGLERPCVLNQGSQPTIPIGFETVEAFIPNFSGNLYGAEVRVDYATFLRPERKFDSIEALKQQVAEDTRHALEFFEDRKKSKTKGV